MLCEEEKQNIFDKRKKDERMTILSNWIIRYQQTHVYRQDGRSQETVHWQIRAFQ